MASSHRSIPSTFAQEVLTQTIQQTQRNGAQIAIALSQEWAKGQASTCNDCARTCLELGDEIERAMQLSLRWGERSKRAFETRPREGYALVGIAQGGDDIALRQQSARALTDIGFHGYAIGGLAVGEPQEPAA